MAAFQASTTPHRILVATVLLFPLGLFMGMAFPLGMKLAASDSAALTPWLWGINGAASVCASVVAVVIGGASLYGGTGNVKGTIIGALIIATLETGMVNLLIPSHNRYIAIGAILVFAVLIDQFFPELVGRGE
jgi:ribose transport system permease protein